MAVRFMTAREARPLPGEYARLSADTAPPTVHQLVIMTGRDAYLRTGRNRSVVHIGDVLLDEHELLEILRTMAEMRDER